MLLPHSTPANPTPSTPVLHYAVNGTPVALFADGTMQIGALQLDQQTAFSLAIALRLPGMHSFITRLERLRQESDALDNGSDQAADRR